MTEDERLLAHAQDLKQQAADRSMPTHTAFLDLHQRTVLKALEKQMNRDVDTFYYGGYPDAERTVAFFLPKFYAASTADEFFASSPEDNPLTLLRVDKDRFHAVTHRDYLGALMGLGVKRELLGDIVTDDDGAFVFCLRTAQDYLKRNLTSVGRASATVREVELSALPARDDVFEERFFSVASVRLDAVLAAAFSLSRTKAGSVIESGAVFVNSVQTLKPDQKLDEGDKLVLRGKGKALLYEIRGESKKGRTHVLIRRYK